MLSIKPKINLINKQKQQSFRLISLNVIFDSVNAFSLILLIYQLTITQKLA